jgi:hypothetical protein
MRDRCERIEGRVLLRGHRLLEFSGGTQVSFPLSSASIHCPVSGVAGVTDAWFLTWGTRLDTPRNLLGNFTTTLRSIEADCLDPIAAVSAGTAYRLWDRLAHDAGRLVCVARRSSPAALYWSRDEAGLLGIVQGSDTSYADLVAWWQTVGRFI